MNVPSPESSSRRVIWLSAALIIVAGAAAYLNTFSVPFLFDDPASITDNGSIRHLWPLWKPLSPPHGSGHSVEGRPLLNLSLAVNYAISGTNVGGYHALNLAIHVLAALTLFGIVRRTLLGGARAKIASPTLFATAAALLWVLHPLQTESVTYVIQRAESLMALFFLFTLYAFIRGAQSARPTWWLVASVAACALGMATKEVMVTAPVVVLLYDYTFMSGGVRDAWRRRRGYYLALAGTWVLLLWLVIGAGNRGGTIGAESGEAWWQYALTQVRAIPHYLGLAFWPHPLIFDYGRDFVAYLGDIVPYALLDLALLVAVAVGLRRRRTWGMLGAAFFVILAPSSSVVGGTRQMIAEHRMYLPLAAVIVLVLQAIHAAFGRRGLFASVALAVGLGFATAHRNTDYRDQLTLYSDTVAKRPGNGWAQYDLGTALLERGRAAEAVAAFSAAAQLMPDFAPAHNNLALALLRVQRVPEAIAEFESTLRLDPSQPAAHDNLGNALMMTDRVPEALQHYAEAARLDPTSAEAHYNFGNALLESGQSETAIEQYRRALALEPNYAAAHNNLANALRVLERPAESIEHYEAALRLGGADAAIHFNLAIALLQLDRKDEATAHLQEALKLKPDFPEARQVLDLVNGAH